MLEYSDGAHCLTGEGVHASVAGWNRHSHAPLLESLRVCLLLGRHCFLASFVLNRVLGVTFGFGLGCRHAECHPSAQLTSLSREYKKLAH